MRVLIGCGGTGGHIYPGVTIAMALQKKFTDLEVLFVGAVGGMEMEIVPTSGYSIVGIPIKGLQRKKIFQNLSLFYLILKSLFRVWGIIRSFKPDVVIGTGGYASFPTLFAAYIKGIPTLIQEQNQSAGLTTKFLSRFVTKICTAYPTLSLPCSTNKITITGNPVRPSIYIFKKERCESLSYFNLVPDKKCLLVLGGSGGADQLNKAILEGLATLSTLEIQLLWITGNKYFKAIKDHIEVHNYNGAYIKCYPFLHPIEFAYGAADVAISRAGALAIAELCVVQKPTIFVPSSYVARDHQTQNCLPLVESNAALFLEDKQCHQYLIPTAISLLHNEEKRLSLIQRMEPFSLLHQDAVQKIVQEVAGLVRSNC